MIMIIIIIIIIIISIHDKDAECLSNIISELLDLDRSKDIIMAKKKNKKKKASKAPSLEGSSKRWITGILNKSF